MRRARAYVAAAGCHALEVNGQVPAPDTRGVCAWTIARKRVLYQTHDITSLLHEQNQTNVVGLMSNGLDARQGMSTPLVRAIVRVEFAGNTAPLVFYTTAAGNGTSTRGRGLRGVDHGSSHAGRQPLQPGAVRR